MDVKFQEDESANPVDVMRPDIWLNCTDAGEIEIVISFMDGELTYTASLESAINDMIDYSDMTQSPLPTEFTKEALATSVTVARLAERLNAFAQGLRSGAQATIAAVRGNR